MGWFRACHPMPSPRPPPSPPRTCFLPRIPPSTDPILLAKIPGTPTALAVDRLRNVFVGTESGTVFLVALDGGVREVHKLAARPVGLTLDRDGTLIIATETGHIVRVKRAEMEVN